MLKEELQTTASLAYLRLGTDEMDRFSESVDRMLEFFATMDTLDVEALEPTTHALLTLNRTRTDESALFNNRTNNNNNNNGTDANSPNSQLLNNVPETEGRLISIPNIL
jgi:aspartyl/glutamyl-tRNA(Asn/Gln) amidotransferase C subunit